MRRRKRERRGKRGKQFIAAGGGRGSRGEGLGFRVWG